MALSRVCYSDDWFVDYDRDRGMYRVSYFQDNHFVDEFWFDAYEEKELGYKELFEQYKWERDVAIAQLVELGLCLGQKIDGVYLTQEKYKELLEYKFMYEELCK